MNESALDVARRGHFNVKGSAYVRQRTAAVRELGSEARLYEVVPRELWPFVGPGIVVGGWYDVMPLLAISRRVALALERPFDELVRERGRKAFENDTRGGVLRPLLRMLVRPQDASRLIPLLYRRTFDFGRSEVQLRGSNSTEGKLSGVPLEFARWMIPLSQGYGVAALESVGARRVRYGWAPPVPDGSAHGIELVRVEYRTAWE